MREAVTLAQMWRRLRAEQGSFEAWHGWQGVCGLGGVVLAAAIATWSGCAWPQGAQPPPVVPRAAGDFAAGVSVVGTPFHRIIPSSTEAADATRLVILYVRIESTADETYWVRPSEMTLAQLDGTVGIGLDPDRARALLERADLLIVDTDQAAGNPAWTDRTAEAQQEVRDVILNELLTDAELQRDGVVRGYLVVDTRSAQPSFDGAALYVGLTGSADGAEVRQRYRFDVAPVATADAPADAAQ